MTKRMSLGEIAWISAMMSRHPGQPKARWMHEWRNWEGDYMAKADWEAAGRAIRDEVELKIRKELSKEKK